MEYNAAIEFTNHIRLSIQQAIKLACQKDNDDVFRQLSAFNYKVVDLAVEENNFELFKTYLSNIAGYYSIASELKKDGAIKSRMYRSCCELAAMNLREVITLTLAGRFEIAEDIGVKEQLNRYTGSAFHFFGWLLQRMITDGTKDWQLLKFAANELDQCSSHGSGKEFELRNELQRLEFDSTANGSNSEEKRRLLDVETKRATYLRHIRIALIYWSDFLYSQNILSLHDLKQVRESFGGTFKFSQPDNYFEDYLHLLKESSRGYLGIDHWDYEVRLSGQVYFPPMPSDWVSLGFVVESLLNETPLSFDSKQPDSTVEHRCTELVAMSERIKSLQDSWLPMFTDETTLDARLKSFVTDIEAIRTNVNKAREVILADLELDPEKVSRFKEIVGKSWEDNATVHKLFVHFENVVEASSDAKLQKVGTRSFQGIKFAFVRHPDHYQMIGGIDLFGGRVGREEDRIFIQALLKGKPGQASTLGLHEVIQKGVEEIKAKGFNCSLIMVGLNVLYREEMLRSTKFKSWRNSAATRDGVLEGTYTITDGMDIPVAMTLTSIFENSVLLIDFHNAAKLHQRKNPDWYNSELYIDVASYDDSTAKKMYADNPKKWNPYGSMTDDEAITSIKTSVMIEVSLEEEFKILNADGFEIYNLT